MYTQPIAGGTGHRPNRIPPANRSWVIERTRAAAIWLHDDRGVEVGISGMADGFDLIWADAVIRAGMQLWAAIPFLEQPDRFPPEARAEWQRLRALAARENITGSLDGLTGRDRSARANQLLYARNARIVLPASYLVICWDHRQVERSGTYNAIKLAAARGFPADQAYHLDPLTREERMRLPEPVPA